MGCQKPYGHGPHSRSPQQPFLASQKGPKMAKFESRSSEKSWKIVEKWWNIFRLDQISMGMQWNHQGMSATLWSGHLGRSQAMGLQKGEKWLSFGSRNSEKSSKIVVKLWNTINLGQKRETLLTRPSPSHRHFCLKKGQIGSRSSENHENS